MTQLDSVVRRLNRNDRGAIEKEWELITLAALASVGQIEHEPDLGGSKKLDVRFRSPSLSFVADVRAVSDEQCNRENPVRELAEELSRHAATLRKQGIEGGFDFSVNGILGSVGSGVHKTKLILPDVHQFKLIIFDKTFSQFLGRIRQDPKRVHHHRVDKPEASLSIVFKPGPENMRWYTHLSYNLPHDLTHNVIYRALERKSNQIKRAGKCETGELAGVILCDGGCGMLRSTKGLHTLSLDEVINAFLSSSSTVDFVCVIDILHSAGSRSLLEFAVRAWSQRHQASADSLRIILNQALQGLPSPLDTPSNTLNYYTWADSLPRLYGQYKQDSHMRHDAIEISLRAAMDYLAGRMDRMEFEAIVHPDWLNHLKRRLDEGKGIAEVCINRCSGQDDDGLVIRFGDPDPAISVFQLPRKLGESRE